MECIIMTNYFGKRISIFFSMLLVLVMSLGAVSSSAVSPEELETSTTSIVAEANLEKCESEAAPMTVQSSGGGLLDIITDFFAGITDFFVTVFFQGIAGLFSFIVEFNSYMFAF